MRKLLVLLESGLLLAGLLLGLAGWEQRRALQQPLQLTEERLLDVPSGATPGALLTRLQDEEVLHGAFWLRLYWRFNLAGQALHSGEYRLKPGMSGDDLLELWREGDVVQYSLTWSRAGPSTSSANCWRASPSWRPPWPASATKR